MGNEALAMNKLSLDGGVSINAKAGETGGI